MPSQIVMPRLGWTMEVGRVVEWLKADGDEVAEGDLILAIESDKAVTEVEALDSGILRIPPDPQIGVELPVGAPLGLITFPGEDAPFGSWSVPPGTPAEDIPVTAALADDGPAAPAVPVGEPVTGSLVAGGPTSTNATSPAANSNGASTIGASSPAISPRARRIATDLGLDWTTLTGSGSSGRIRESDIRTALATISASPTTTAATTGATRATPGVRRMAADAGVDLTTVPPGRPGGRITRADVAAATSVPPPIMGEALSPIRRVIVQRMTDAARTVAPVTLTTDADATDLVRLRAMLKHDGAEGDIVPSYTDLIARLTALALLKHPEMNASLADDRIVRHLAVHIGIAVDTGRGLLAPVVRDADRKSAFDIAVESADLIARTRAGTAPADVLGGSTFTITNLGMFDVDAFTPIINLPECAILGLGRIVARPVVVDEETEEIAVRKMMALSLTFDHRVVDGAPAARFLQTLRRTIERPVGWLMR